MRIFLIWLFIYIKFLLKWYAICKYLIKNEKKKRISLSQSHFGTKLAHTQKQTIFRQNFFGNFYSTLNYLLNGILYVKSFWFQLFFLSTQRHPWKSWKLCKVEFSYMDALPPANETTYWMAKRYLQIFKIGPPSNLSLLQ